MDTKKPKYMAKLPKELVSHDFLFCKEKDGKVTPLMNIPKFTEIKAKVVALQNEPNFDKRELGKKALDEQYPIFEGKIFDAVKELEADAHKTFQELDEIDQTIFMETHKDFFQNYLPQKNANNIAQPQRQFVPQQMSK